jgi:hypothetical protein
MGQLSTLQLQFKDDLRAALFQAVQGRAPDLFDLSDTNEHSRGRKLQLVAQQIIELRTSGLELASRDPAAARYLEACLKWQHVHGANTEAVPLVAKALAQELGLHAN